MTEGGESPKPAATQNASTKEGASGSSRTKKFWTAIGLPVLVIVLGSWLTPVPSEIAKLFEHHHSNGGGSVGSSPLLVATREEVGPCSHAWIVDKPESAVLKPPSSDAPSPWESWISKAKAIDVGYTNIVTTIQARPGQVVYITGFQFDVARRSPPVHGTTVTVPCAGPDLGRFVSANLDSEPPRISATSSDPTAIVGGMSTTPLKLPYQVTNSDALVLIINAYVKKYYCTWSADIMWASNGKTGDFVIENNGAPFQTTPWVMNQKTLLGGQ